MTADTKVTRYISEEKRWRLRKESEFEVPERGWGSSIQMCMEGPGTEQGGGLMLLVSG